MGDRGRSNLVEVLLVLSPLLSAPANDGPRGLPDVAAGALSCSACAARGWGGPKELLALGFPTSQTPRFIYS